MRGSLRTQALQYKPRVVILDLGGSYRWITKFLDGAYLSMNLEEGGKQPKLSPFSLPPSERTTQFLSSWITQLLSLGQYEVSPEDVVDIRERIQDLYRLPYKERTLGNLQRLLAQRMWPPLSKWVDDGPWAPTFDGPPEEFAIARDEWQVIDLAGAQEHPDWCTAALFYLFERLRLSIDDDSQIDRLKIMVVDEAWRYLADPAVLTSLMEAAKTWRKRNAALILATQSVVDLTQNPQATALLEMLPTKLFLANPDFPESAADTLSLTEAQLDIIRGLEPKQEMYLHRSVLDPHRPGDSARCGSCGTPRCVRLPLPRTSSFRILARRSSSRSSSFFSSGPASASCSRAVSISVRSLPSSCLPAFAG